MIVGVMMPLYEYRCRSCRRRVTVLVRGSSGEPAACPECGGSELERVFSSFAMPRSDRAVYDDILSDNQMVRGLMRNDPRALADWNRKMSQGTGEGVAPQYEEMLQRMEAGEMPQPPAKKDQPAPEPESKPKRGAA